MEDHALGVSRTESEHGGAAAALNGRHAGQSERRGDLIDAAADGQGVHRPGGSTSRRPVGGRAPHPRVGRRPCRRRRLAVEFRRLPGARCSRSYHLRLRLSRYSATRARRIGGGHALARGFRLGTARGPASARRAAIHDRLHLGDRERATPALVGQELGQIGFKLRPARLQGSARPMPPCPPRSPCR